MVLTRAEASEACGSVMADGVLAFGGWARNIEDWQGRPDTEPLPPRSTFDALLLRADAIVSTCGPGS